MYIREEALEGRTLKSFLVCQPLSAKVDDFPAISESECFE